VATNRLFLFAHKQKGIQTDALFAVAALR